MSTPEQAPSFVVDLILAAIAVSILGVLFVLPSFAVMKHTDATAVQAWSAVVTGEAVVAGFLGLVAATRFLAFRASAIFFGVLAAVNFLTLPVYVLVDWLA